MPPPQGSDQRLRFPSNPRWPEPRARSEFEDPAMKPDPVRIVLLGGFLGAGKTTAIARLARSLEDRGSRVGIITNDQADLLVDTRTLQCQGFAVEQVAGACFCCHFDALTRSAAEIGRASC